MLRLAASSEMVLLSASVSLDDLVSTPSMSSAAFSKSCLGPEALSAFVEPASTASAF